MHEHKLVVTKRPGPYVDRNGLSASEALSQYYTTIACETTGVNVKFHHGDNGGITREEHAKAMLFSGTDVVADPRWIAQFDEHCAKAPGASK